MFSDTINACRDWLDGKSRQIYTKGSGQAFLLNKSTQVVLKYHIVCVEIFNMKINVA